MKFLCSAMFLIFLTLKLLGIIAWPWIWVTAPLWGWILFFLFCVFLYVLGMIVHDTPEKRLRRACQNLRS